MSEIDFPFPFKPYDIQLDFMRELYSTLENGKLGIFESPTGTGKSLSLICGALTWLQDHEGRKRRELELAIDEKQKCVERMEKGIEEQQKTVESSATGVNWLETTGRRNNMRTELMELKKGIVTQNSEIDEMLGEIQKMKHVFDAEFGNGGDDFANDDIILNEYASDEECNEAVGNGESDDEESDATEHITKIYYCSRTHSQLSQFISEVKRSPFSTDVRVVPLSSRQNSCINDAVLNLKSLNLMNNRCIEMQKSKDTKRSIDGEVLKKRKSTCKCPFYRQAGIENMKDKILVEISEIEDLAKHGRKTKTCPYYSSRYAVPLAQLVVVPYNTLLHKSTREACGIALNGNIVIIDEAHNLLDAVSSMHSCQLTGCQLTGALSQLQQYVDRYKTRFSAKNLYHIKQIIFILQTMLKFIQSGSAAKGVTVMTPNRFLVDTQTDHLNFYDILRFCKKSGVSRKLLGFSEIYQPNVKTLEANGKSSVSSFLDKMCGKKQSEQTAVSIDTAKNHVPSSPIQQVEEFFRCLNNRNENGRIFLTRESNLEKSTIRYCLMNPAIHFQDIVSTARAVIVAGGTMQPIEEFSNQLFQMAGAPKERIVTFSCGHVIPATNLTALALAQGPSGLELDFSYKNRNSMELKNELGRILVNVCNIIPGGIVCFFSSYDYAEDIVSHWRKNGILTKMEIKKTIFQEPRKANEINEILSQYSKCVWKSRSGTAPGAILFSVVGGKMSEGINFSDDLARCIIMIGMPYPNIKSPELQEKMQYLNANLSKSVTGNAPGQMYYENLCMKAINQSIGRAIRHKDDYAAIILLDKRYSRDSIQSALPGWIRDRLRNYPAFGPAFAEIRKQTLNPDDSY